MSPSRDPSSPTRWAHFRFSVVGSLLSSPPPRGELQTALSALAGKTWQHPITGQPVTFAVVTIERWYYQARNSRVDPVGALRRSLRKDLGQQPALPEPQRLALLGLYQAHRRWTVKLTYDNLAVLVQQDPTMGALPSYSTVLRFMRAHGLTRVRRRRGDDRAGAERAQARLDCREVRSYEAEYAGALWHLDFHFCSLKVLTPEGEWLRPVALAILDDYSRLLCHIQWYLSETAEDLVHGLCQGFGKRGLPRSLMTDNGPAMLSEEVRAGLLALGIVHETTLPYSPYQNGKQEAFWAVLEGRLMAMLEGVKNLSLTLLQEASQAWVELEYNRAVHSQIKEKPLDRFLRGPDVLRPCPAIDTLRDAFRQETVRTQRKSDGTVSLDGVRFEVPGCFRHLERLTIRYARWNLGRVHLVDEHTGTLLSQLYPQDKTENAAGKRRLLEPSILSQAPPPEPSQQGMAPLLKKLLSQYAATGLPPAYLPKPQEPKKDAEP